MNAYRRAGKVRDMFAPVPDTDPCPDDLTAQRDRVLAALTCLRLEEIGDDTSMGAYHAGCVVAEYVGVTGDYAISRFASRFGLALLAARRELVGRKPGPGGWSDADVTAVASAVGLIPTVVAPAGAVVIRRG